MNVDMAARNVLGGMDDAIQSLPLAARRVLTRGHEMQHRETARENGPSIQTLQIFPHTALVINPVVPSVCYFRTNGTWYKLDTVSSTTPRKIKPEDMELSNGLQCRTHQSLFAQHDIDLDRRMVGQLPCTGPQWAAASILLNSKTAQVLATGIRKAIDGPEKWSISLANGPRLRLEHQNLLDHATDTAI